MEVGTMNRTDIIEQIEELQAEMLEGGNLDEGRRIEREIDLFTLALTCTDEVIADCQAALPGRASVLRMAIKLNN